MLHLEPGWRVLLRRGIRRGAVSLWSERDWGGNLAAFTGIFILVQILGVGLAITLAAERLLEERTAVHLEMREGVSDGRISEIIIDLRTLPYVSRADLVTKEQAYNAARESDPGLIGFLEQYGLPNPFHDSITVTLEDAGSYKALLHAVESGPWNESIDPEFFSTTNTEREYIEGLMRFTGGMRALALLIICVGAATLIAIVVTLGKARAMARTEEVLVERLAGAQSATIVLPFIVEATLLMAIAAVVSMSLVTLTIAASHALFPALSAPGALGELWSEVRALLKSFLPTALVIELICIPPLATLGTWLGIGNCIRSPRIAIT
ncbi:hypothetical protein FJZ27_04440 [Candidatus Peribacteria bacterium]|nr:hypothetical protein [Candidatus Peribacteria bacterium]